MTKVKGGGWGDPCGGKKGKKKEKKSQGQGAGGTHVGSKRETGGGGMQIPSIRHSKIAAYSTGTAVQYRYGKQYRKQEA